MALQIKVSVKTPEGTSATRTIVTNANPDMFVSAKNYAVAANRYQALTSESITAVYGVETTKFGSGDVAVTVQPAQDTSEWDEDLLVTYNNGTQKLTQRVKNSGWPPSEHAIEAWVDFYSSAQIGGYNGVEAYVESTSDTTVWQA